ncbi:MAG: hypothetical protein N4A45_06120 [Flavobacteriales bacterium]|nr:hypothetical protein [Flavobacteriales bacterium]
MFNLTIAQVGIGTVSPDESAILDVKATAKGFLLPRLTEMQRDAINNGNIAEGLLIYNLDKKCIEVFNGTVWKSTCGSSVSNAISALRCDSILLPSGNPVINTNHTGTLQIPYENGDGSVYTAGSVIQSTGITGYQLELQAGTLNSGNGNLIFNLSGTSPTTGIATFAVDFQGHTCNLDVNIIEDQIRIAIVAGGNAADLACYDSKNVNEWCSVSNATYQAVANNLQNASKTGRTDGFMSGTPVHGKGVAPQVPGQNALYLHSYSSVSFPSYPNGNDYIVAFTHKSKASNGNIMHYRMAWGNSVAPHQGQFNGRNYYGETFPNIAINSFSQYYYVLKRPTLSIPANPILILENVSTISANASNPQDIIGAAGGGQTSFMGYCTSQNSPNCTNQESAYSQNEPPYIQMISTSTKSW